MLDCSSKGLVGIPDFLHWHPDTQYITFQNSQIHVLDLTSGSSFNGLQLKVKGFNKASYSSTLLIRTPSINAQCRSMLIKILALILNTFQCNFDCH